MVLPFLTSSVALLINYKVQQGASVRLAYLRNALDQRIFSLCQSRGELAKSQFKLKFEEAHETVTCRPGCTCQMASRRACTCTPSKRLQQPWRVNSLSFGIWCDRRPGYRAELVAYGALCLSRQRTGATYLVYLCHNREQARMALFQFKLQKALA
jgi:hypothetical protein